VSLCHEFCTCDWFRSVWERDAGEWLNAAESILDVNTDCYELNSLFQHKGGGTRSGHYTLDMKDIE